MDCKRGGQRRGKNKKNPGRPFRFYAWATECGRYYLLRWEKLEEDQEF